ncbi:hypothetical protein AtDm6_0494 [Acetobacter tropicalis]|uniref:Uncharacterized protein n=1 Tax=Acetobacter tropicalis TaxID=104102 RepID=A0A094YW46_9PROT|nr:hypothetical protein AtDm6_0494 [Acetobacter tropicalis]
MVLLCIVQMRCGKAKQKQVRKNPARQHASRVFQDYDRGRIRLLS